MGIPQWSNLKEEEQKEYLCLLNRIIGLAQSEIAAIQDGRVSLWTAAQLDGVIREMQELLQYALKGELYFKYGIRQRLLESTYKVTDSLNDLTHTPLGIQIYELQDKIDAAGRAVLRPDLPQKRGI